MLKKNKKLAETCCNQGFHILVSVFNYIRYKNIMNSRGTLRYNPSCTHICTTKFNRQTANKIIKAILTIKAGRFKRRPGCRHLRIGNKRRLYYHDHRYDDPWNFTEDSRIRFSDIFAISSQYMHNNPDLAVYMNDIKSIHDKKTLNRNSYHIASPQVLDEKHLQVKRLYKPKCKVKQGKVAYHSTSDLKFTYYFLQGFY